MWYIYGALCIDCFVPIVILSVLLALAVLLIIALSLYVILLRRRPTLKPHTPGSLSHGQVHAVESKRNN